MEGKLQNDWYFLPENGDKAVFPHDKSGPNRQNQTSGVLKAPEVAFYSAASRDRGCVF